jgi:hypothetical protein
MLNRTVLTDVFDFRVRDAAVILEEGRQPPAGNVAALVDSRRQYSPTILAIPDRIIGAATEE